jgi:hypothetical protein
VNVLRLPKVEEWGTRTFDLLDPSDNTISVAMVGMVAIESVFMSSPQSRDNKLFPYIEAPNDSRRRTAAIQFRAFLALSVFMKLGVRGLTPPWDLSTAL